MKIPYIIRPAVLLAAFWLLSGCGSQEASLALGPDGYGKTTLPNGITVLVNRDETTSLTGARILIGGGVLTETADNNGIANLMIRMLLKGNDSLSAAQVTERLDFLGASVSAECFRDFSAISVVSLTENFDEVLTILSRSLTAPTFPETELIKLKQEVEGEIKAASDNQTQASSDLLWKTIYGDHGYGLPWLGTTESVAKISVDDIRRHYQKFVGGKNIIFSIATDLPTEKIAALVTARLGDIKPEAENIPVPALTLQADKEGFISFDRNQSFIFTGAVLPHLPADEVPCLILTHQVLGGNVGSRLWGLRQTEKLAYAVYSQYALSRNAAMLRAAIGTDTSKVKTALASLDREWSALCGQGITAQELADAKANMKNRLIFQIDRKGGRANDMATNEYLGYGYRFTLDLIARADQVTLEEVNRFIKQRFADAARYIAIVGKK